MSKFQKIFFLLMVIITAPAMFYLSEKVKPMFVEKQYRVVSNYSMPAGKFPKAIRWDRVLESPQGYQIKEPNISIEDTLKYPTGSLVSGSFVEDQAVGVKFQYFIEKSMKILSLVMLVFGIISMISVLRTFIKCKEIPILHKGQFCCYCGAPFKEGETVTRNMAKEVFHENCWDEFMCEP